MLAVLVLLSGLAARGTTAAPSPADHSVAKAHAEVIAHGVTALPADQVAWRVVEDTAELPGDANIEQRALGFALATEGSILNADAATGQRTRLAVGEAVFVPDQAEQVRASLGGAAVAYDRIALVPAANAQDAGGDTLIFDDDAFAAPSGDRDLALVRDVLFRDEITPIDDTGTPILILATTASVTVKTVDGPKQTLKAGESATFDGGVQVSPGPGAGLDDGASFVAALIGPEVPNGDTVLPAAPTDGGADAGTGTGSVTLVMHDCVDEVAFEDLSPDVCAVATDGFDTRLFGPTDSSDLPALSLGDAAPGDDGSFTWSGLAFGDYDLVETGHPDGDDRYVAPGFPRIHGSALTGYAIGLDEANPDVRIDVYNLPARPLPPSAASDHTITVRVHACPAGMTVGDYDGDACGPPAESMGVTLLQPPADAGGEWGAFDPAETIDDEAYTWTFPDIEASVYRLTLSLPNGYDQFAVPNTELDGDSGDYLIRPYGNGQGVIVDVYVLRSGS
jgi:hypothetical protein